MNSLLPLELMQRSIAGLTGEKNVTVARGYGDVYVATWGSIGAEFDMKWALLSLDEFERRFATSFLPKRTGTADTAALRTKVLRLANYLADGEIPTAQDMRRPFADLVSTIYSQTSTSPVQMALIAVELARHIEGQS